MSNSLSLPEMLKLLDDGNLSPEERAAYQEKLQSSSTLELAAQASMHETFVSELRTATKSATLPPFEVTSQFCNVIMAKAQQLASDETHIGQIGQGPTNALEAAKGDYDFLAPAQEPGELGRLANYRVLGPLGQGGMGLVFEAEDTQLHRRVALKVMKPNLATDPEHRHRFMKEAQAAARVEHDHICPIYQVGEHVGMPFIAMPFLQGEMLYNLLERGPIPLTQAIQITIQVAQGLAAAHEADLIHRDIKPSNIWLERPNTSNGLSSTTRVRLLDFGLARIDRDCAPLTQSGVILGTPGYMSPEQARSLPIDARSDLFSLGVVLYEMLTQKRPFDGDNVVSVLTSLAVDHPKNPEEIRGDLPPALSQLVMRLLSKSPGDRPACAADVATSLQTIAFELQNAPAGLIGLPTLVHENSPEAAEQIDSVAASKQPPGRSRRRGVWAAAAAGATVFLTIILTLVTRDGELSVEYDGDADVRIKGGEIQLFENNQLKYTLSASEKNHRLAAGKYRVKLVGVDGIELETETVEIQRQGVFKLKAFAKPTKVRTASQPDASSDTSQPFRTLTSDYFPGRLVLLDLFDDGSRTKLPLDRLRTIEDEKYVIAANELSAQNVNVRLGPELESGALYVRCRGARALPFLNFCIRNDSDRQFRWLSFAPKRGQWELFLAAHDIVDGKLSIRPSVRIAEGHVKGAELDVDQWLDISVRWSRSDFDIWLNGRYITGGKLPSGELVIGRPMAVQLCANRTMPGEIKLEIKQLGLWDQSNIPSGEVAPKGLSRQEPGLPNP